MHFSVWLLQNVLPLTHFLLCTPVDSFCLLILGQLARKVYEGMRREAASLRIQRDLRMHLARKAYKELCSSAVSIQTGIRGMAVRNELRFRRQTRVAMIIQVGQGF